MHCPQLLEPFADEERRGGNGRGGRGGGGGEREREGGDTAAKAKVAFKRLPASAK